MILLIKFQKKKHAVISVPKMYLFGLYDDGPDHSLKLKTAPGPIVYSVISHLTFLFFVLSFPPITYRQTRQKYQKFLFTNSFAQKN